MEGERARTTLVALSLLVGLAVAPGFALTATTDADASISGVIEHDDGANAAQEGQGDDANVTLDTLTIGKLTLENVTVENALIEQATVDGENRSNLTAKSVTVESATLTNVTFANVTLTDRGMISLVVGQARATSEQNNTLESLEVSDRTISGLLIREATVQNASDVQLGETEDEAEQGAQLTATGASIVVENVTVESISQDESDGQASDETETESDA